MKKFFFITLLLCIYTLAKAQNQYNLIASIENDETSVQVQWRHTDNNVLVYTLQKSKDNIVFSDIFTQQNNAISIGEIVKFNDEINDGDVVFYRLKIKRFNKNQETSLPVNITHKQIKNNWQIYPVPAIGEIIHLNYTGTGVIDGVIKIQIQNIRSGTIFTKLRLASNTKNIQIPLSNIGKGLYVVRVSIGNRPEWTQQFARY